MAINRGIDGPDPVRSDPIGRLSGPREKRPDFGSWVMAEGTLACPACDAPVAPGPRALSPAEAIGCPVCAHDGAVRDFLSLSAPTRPARVDVRVVMRPRPVARALAR